MYVTAFDFSERTVGGASKRTRDRCCTRLSESGERNDLFRTAEAGKIAQGRYRDRKPCIRGYVIVYRKELLSGNKLQQFFLRDGSYTPELLDNCLFYVP